MSTTGRSGFDRRRVRARAWVQLVAGGVFAAIAVLTALVPTWIEVAFGVEPDGGSGALERVVVFGCGALALASLGLAGREWRRAAAT